jgi:hypothetical protein
VLVLYFSMVTKSSVQSRHPPAVCTFSIVGTGTVFSLSRASAFLTAAGTSARR